MNFPSRRNARAGRMVSDAAADGLSGIRRNPFTGFYVAYSTQPLNTWEIAGSYGTAADAERQSSKPINERGRIAPIARGCALIAADNPRLKSKEVFQ